MLKKVFASLLCIGLVFHLGLTLIYNTPSNPLKAKYNNYISFYMDPLFTQNWKLFAPTPVTNSSEFYVKAKLKTEDGVKTTGWIDLVNYMIDKNYDNRFTPYNRLLRIPRGAYTLRQEKDETIQEIIKKVNDGQLEKEKYEHLIESDRNKADAEKSMEILNRFAEAHLSSTYLKENIIEYKVLLVETEPIPFSKNGNANFKNKEHFIEFEWTKPQNVVSMF
ncbi:MAG: DUF5819 family protein [Bacillota bacterium]